MSYTYKRTQHKLKISRTNKFNFFSNKNQFGRTFLQLQLPAKSQQDVHFPSANSHVNKRRLTTYYIV